MNKLVVGGIIVIALLAISAGSLTGLFTASSGEKVKVAHIAIVQSGPLYYAVEKGYFNQEGIDLELVKFDAPKQIVDAVVLNQVDFGGPGSATGISAIAESLKPGNLKYYTLSCLTPETGNNLIVKKDSSITSLKELEGKKIAHLPGPQWRTIVNRILKRNNIDTSKTELVDLAVPLQLQALASGNVDAVVALDPVATIGIEKGIAKTLVAGIAEKNIATPLCAGAGIISTKFMNEKPKTAEKVLKVMQKAIQDYNQDKQNQISMMIKYVGMEEETASKLPFPSNDFIFYTDLDVANKQATQKFIDMFYEDGVMQKRVMVEDVLLS